MGDNKRQSNYVALITCAVCMLFTLVTCSLVLEQYFRWQNELTDLKDQVVKALPACSPSGKDVDTVQKLTRSEALMQEPRSKDVGSPGQVLSEKLSYAPRRLRRSVGESGKGGRIRHKQKKNETRQGASGSIHMTPQRPQPPKKSRNLQAIQFKLDGEKYNSYTDNSKVKILQWWNPEDWVHGIRSDVFEFNKLTGELTIRQDGLYYVYAQITYKNPAAMNSFDVKINNNATALSCTQDRRFQKGSKPETSIDTCHVASVVRLLALQTLSIFNAIKGNFYRRMDDSTGATFWGVMRIGNS